MIEYTSAISAKLALPEKNVTAALTLLSEGATIPFIARYRKDMTGALDEVVLQKIQEEYQTQKEFVARKAFIEKTISEQEKMSPELQEKLDAATTLNELEDIYLPYKPKRKTRAQKARELGLTPLAEWILLQQTGSVEEKAAGFLNEEIKDAASALQGARDIIAEQVSEDAESRAQVRSLFENQGTVTTSVLPGKEAEAVKFKDYFEFSEPVSRIPSHRMLAVLRGFMEGFLRLAIEPKEEEALALLHKKFIYGRGEASQQVEKALREAYRRLLQPSLESEFRMALKTRSDEEAIEVFAENLKQLLLSPPIGNKRILAIDPGYRTGCKVVVLDDTGMLLKTSLIYVHEKNHRLQEAGHVITDLVTRHGIQCFAVGDGTAGREAEQFIKSLKLGLPVFLVNEDGASIYSASEIAREEFPDQDITVRGAVSIGRRLMDPLAELVKIEPKSIGVGQYQHDVNQFRLKSKLDQTVEHCVNAMGVNLNTAGKRLLQYVSGIGPVLAENIVRYREEHGAFKSRKDLLSVPRLGASAFEQCAGFLRIKNGSESLDTSGVHPEAYPLVEKIATDLGISVKALIANEAAIARIEPSRYIDDRFGRHTVEDLLKELRKPGLDPRPEAQIFEFAPIYGIDDVHAGMVVPGIVTNLTRFGAFVDIGVKQDGLVHVSEIAHRYLRDPSEALKLSQHITVRVLEVDQARKRISLSIKQVGLADTPANQTRSSGNKKKVATADTHSFEDALSALKKKFR